MTRLKKSRKVGTIGTRKQETRPADTKTPRKNKKPKGQPSGSRNSLIEENAVSTPQNQNKKTNPKLGSKKPISLVASEKPQVKEQKPIEHSKAKPQVKLSKVQVIELEPQVELENIESDERLLNLAERVEDGETLTGKDAKYFNKMMERLDELLVILGLDDEDEDDDSGLEEFEEDAMQKLGGSEWDDLLEDEKK